MSTSGFREGNIYTIEKVTPVLYRGSDRNEYADQLVALDVKGHNEPVYLSYAQVRANTEIDVGEVEIIEGSSARIVFYEEGEAMYNGEVCTDGNAVKEFWINIKDTIDELRTIYSGELTAKRIEEIFVTVGNRDVFVVGFNIGEEDIVYIPLGSLLSSTGLEVDDLKNLVGSYIDPEYYQAGDMMWSGEICRKSGAILKHLNLRINGVLEEMIENRCTTEIYDHHDYWDDIGHNGFQDETDWTHYNDALDMDQQSPDFWNQF